MEKAQTREMTDIMYFGVTCGLWFAGIAFVVGVFFIGEHMFNSAYQRYERYVKQTTALVEQSLSNEQTARVVIKTRAICRDLKRHYIRKMRSANAVVGSDCSARLLVVHPVKH